MLNQTETNKRLNELKCICNHYVEKVNDSIYQLLIMAVPRWKCKWTQWNHEWILYHGILIFILPIYFNFLVNLMSE